MTGPADPADLTALQDLLDRTATGDREARRSLLEHYDGADADARHDLLDGLAATASAGSRPAMEALVELVHRHRLAIPTIADVLVDPADIDDAAQLTLIAVAERVPSFEGRSRFRSWLRTIARNEALQVLRRKRRRAEPAGDGLPEPAGDDGFVRRLSSVVVDEFVVRQAIERITEPYRTALVMREMQGLEYGDIADLLGVPVGTVRSRIARARGQLAQQVWQW